MSLSPTPFPHWPSPGSPIQIKSLSWHVLLVFVHRKKNLKMSHASLWNLQSISHAELAKSRHQIRQT